MGSKKDGTELLAFSPGTQYQLTPNCFPFIVIAKFKRPKPLVFNYTFTDFHTTTTIITSLSACIEKLSPVMLSYLPGKIRTLKKKVYQ